MQCLVLRLYAARLRGTGVKNKEATSCSFSLDACLLPPPPKQRLIDTLHF